MDTDIQPTKVVVAVILAVALVVPTSAVLTGGFGDGGVYRDLGVVLSPTGTANGGYAEVHGDGTVTLNLTSVGGNDTGVNDDGITVIDRVFFVENRGDGPREVWLTTDADPAVTITTANGEPIPGPNTTTTLTPGQRFEVNIRVDTTGVETEPGTTLLTFVQLHVEELPDETVTPTPTGTPASGGGGDGDAGGGSGGGGGSSSDSVQPPTAALSGPSTATVGESVTFDASESTDNAGIESYEWDLDGDGVFEREQSSPTLTTTFDDSGERTVTVRVVDRADLTDTASVSLTVEARASSGGGDAETTPTTPTAPTQTPTPTDPASTPDTPTSTPDTPTSTPDTPTSTSPDSASTPSTPTPTTSTPTPTTPAPSAEGVSVGFGDNDTNVTITAMTLSDITDTDDDETPTPEAVIEANQTDPDLPEGAVLLGARSFTTVGETVELDGTKSVIDTTETVDREERIVKLVDISVPEERRNQTATIRIEVERSALEGTDPEAARIGHHTGTGWQLLRTRVVDSTPDTVVLQTRTDTFSPFAVFKDPEVRYQWTLPSGETLDGETALATFGEPGLFNVSLEVTNSFDRSDSTEYPVLVNDRPSVQIGVLQRDSTDVDGEVSTNLTAALRSASSGDTLTLVAVVDDEVGRVAERTIRWQLPSGATTRGQTVNYTVTGDNETVGLAVTDEFGAEDRTAVGLQAGGGSGGGSAGVVDALDVFQFGLAPATLGGILLVVGLLSSLAFVRGSLGGLPGWLVGLLPARSHPPAVAEFGRPQIDPEQGVFTLETLRIVDDGEDIEQIEIAVRDDDRTVFAKTVETDHVRTYEATPETVHGAPIQTIGDSERYTITVRVTDAAGDATTEERAGKFVWERAVDGRENTPNADRDTRQPGDGTRRSDDGRRSDDSRRSDDGRRSNDDSRRSGRSGGGRTATGGED